MTLQTVTAPPPAPARLPSAQQPPADEADLSERVRCGDRAAFMVLWERYKSPIYNHVYRYMADPVEAQDVLQDVFIKAWQGAPRVSHTLCFGKWLYRVASNVCIDMLRHQRVLHWVNVDTLIAEGGALRRMRGDVGHSRLDWAQSSLVAQDRTMLPETSALTSEQTAEVLRVLDCLLPQQRQYLILREYYDYTYDEIVALMGTTHAAVKSQLFRAREAFRKEAKRQNLVSQP